MRIAMFTNTYLPHVGGVANSVQRFSRELRRQGHEVLVIAPEFQGCATNEQEVVRIPAIQKFNGTDFSVALPAPRELYDRLSDFSPQVVHSHHPFLLGDTALRVAAELSLPLVFTHHTMYEQYTHYVPADSAQMKRFVIDLVSGYANLSSAVIAPSDSVAEILRERKVAAPLHVIPTGIDLQRFTPGAADEFRVALDIPAGARVAGHVGRLAPEKNLEFLCGAMCGAMREDDNLFFLVVGDGPELPRIEQQFSDAGLDGRLRIAGARTGSELVQAYRAMQVFVFSSRSETQGMVLVEALACGVPVVALDAPGVREVVVEGRNGRLLDSADPAIFSETALKTIAEYSGEKGRLVRESVEQYSIERCARALATLYEALAGEKRKPSDTDRSIWWSALKRMEVEWELWRNYGSSLVEAVFPPPSGEPGILRRKLDEWRSYFNRHEWIIRLFKLPRLTRRTHEPGLIMIQIDGLGRTQFESALAQRRLPYLRRLLTIDDYQLLSLYSGLPSTTPAVQGELFYGKRCAVPAFSYFKRDERRLMRMYDTPASRSVEHDLANEGEALLAGGSSYSNIYSGGADEVHFCAAATGWNKLLGTSNPLRIVLAMIPYAWMVVRIVGLAVLEILLASIELIRGTTSPRHFLVELKFLISRVAVSVVLREVITLGACIDVTRGLRVIHVNFLGYDEQAHRRGPASAYAEWALKGIDQAIRKIHRSARRGKRRKYQLCIYSDHGQEGTVSYQQLFGETVEQAIADVFQWPVRGAAGVSDAAESISLKRAAYVSRRFFGERERPSTEQIDPEEQIVVAAMGPLGHIYLPRRFRNSGLERDCRRLVERGRIPLVLWRGADDAVWAFTEHGRFLIPDRIRELLPDSHRFAEEAGRDLAALVRSPDSGDIVISGWRGDQPPLTFPIESGSHAGPGPNETHAFVLLPPSAPSLVGSNSYLRPGDLREIALQLQGRSHTRRQYPVKPRRHKSALRVMTYNVHSCIGTDGRLDLRRIAQVIAYYDPDLAALQELDVSRRRTGGSDQARELARLLRMESHFHPAYSIAEEQFGDAILSKYPMRLRKAAALPGHPNERLREPRGALWVEVEFGGMMLQVINTHLGLSAVEREAQISALLGAEWLETAAGCGPLIFLGDLNAFPRSRVCRRVAERLRDVQALEGVRPHRTWHGHFPISRIDHIFVAPEFEIMEVMVPRTSLTREASDHLPVIADLRLHGEAQRLAETG